MMVYNIHLKTDLRLGGAQTFSAKAFGHIFILSISPLKYRYRG